MNKSCLGLINFFEAGSINGASMQTLCSVQNDGYERPIFASVGMLYSLDRDNSLYYFREKAFAHIFYFKDRSIGEEITVPLTNQILARYNLLLSYKPASINLYGADNKLIDVDNGIMEVTPDIELCFRGRGNFVDFEPFSILQQDLMVSQEELDLILGEIAIKLCQQGIA
jgi:hypothetical protein